MKTKKTLKIAIIAGLSLIIVLAVWQNDAQSRTKTYYSGEAVTFRGNLIFATVNTGALELFALKDDKIVRTAMFKPRFVSLPKGSTNYHDVQFDVVDGHLYMYLINGTYLYKYDVSNPDSPMLLEKKRDNAWDWFMQLDKVDDYLVTVGTNNIKYWNDNLQVIKTYKVDYQKAENVSFSRKGDLIFSVIDNIVQIYDTDKREIISDIWLSAKEGSIRGVYGDSVKNEIYVVDDIALKVFDYFGNELRRFDNAGGCGYDVESSNVSDSVYFSGGVGVVRNDKNTLNAVDWKYTTRIGAGDSSAWAMDIEVTGDSQGDKIVVFNNTEILVMDNELELIDYFKAREIDEAPIEALHIGTDKRQAMPGDYVTVSGGGFGMNEEIVVKMGKKKWLTTSDTNGRFKRVITVIDIKPQITDIKVEGLQSKLTYSISFKIN